MDELSPQPDWLEEIDRKFWQARIRQLRHELRQEMRQELRQPVSDRQPPSDPNRLRLKLPTAPNLGTNRLG